ncbi:helix-hairpin-helix domain-containing protein [Actinokineospora sp.]|uniref:helix-hairpin-helix domain-containing protein n=1 Tax=Actinokineospora sp. TaxID=1872133 RepID=UPI0040379D5E
MFDTTSRRAARIDDVLDRLSKIAGRPWDTPAAAPSHRGQATPIAYRLDASTPRHPPGTDQLPAPGHSIPPDRITGLSEPMPADQPLPPDKGQSPDQCLPSEQGASADHSSAPTAQSSPSPAEVSVAEHHPGADLLDLGRPWWQRGRLGRLVRRWTPEPDSDSVASRTSTPWWRRRPDHLVREWSPDDPHPPVQRRRVPVALLVGLVVVGAVVAAFVTLSDPPTVEAPPDLPVAATSVDPVSATPAAGVVIDVVGKVATPGLLTLPEGSRVADAIKASGGALPGADLSALNLARRLVDGEQVHVGIPVPASAATNAAQSGPVDLNSATAAQLDTLPGVGTVTAQRILDWRTRHGRFTKVEQLREVDGIGPARFDTLRDLVTVR